jgi:hypothetical protein
MLVAHSGFDVLTFFHDNQVKPLGHRQAPFSHPPTHQMKEETELVLQSTDTFLRTPDHGSGYTVQ